jgi:hypothetical protein
MTVFLQVEPTDTVLEVKQKLQALIDKVGACAVRGLCVAGLGHGSCARALPSCCVDACSSPSPPLPPSPSLPAQPNTTHATAARPAAAAQGRRRAGRREKAGRPARGKRRRRRDVLCGTRWEWVGWLGGGLSRGSAGLHVAQRLRAVASAVSWRGSQKCLPERLPGWATRVRAAASPTPHTTAAPAVPARTAGGSGFEAVEITSPDAPPDEAAPKAEAG